jgi:hypothetical protein
VRAMSLLNRDRYRKKLQDLLERAEDEAFFEMVWAINALQSGRVQPASRLIKFPAEAATSEFSSRFSIHRWELETLIGQLLITPKISRRAGPNRITNCRLFAAGATAVNYLRKLEDAEAGIYLKHFSVLNEMHRIGQRQFAWQRGYRNAAQLYRYAYIYGQGQCAEYFTRTYGLTMNEFSLIGFGLFSSLQDRPWLLRPFSMVELGIAPPKMEAALTLLSTPIGVARREAPLMAQPKNSASLPVAYQPSILRRFPIVTFGQGSQRLRAPLPELILLRVTSGVYYDLIKGEPHLRNEASDRFERYSAEYIAAMMRRFDVGRGYKYKVGKRVVDTPDILIRDCGEVVIAVECKATKLTFAAQYGDDPTAGAKRAYDEIAKGIFQLWRYFSHVRRGIVTKDVVRSEARGVVLTIDTWLVMSPDLHKEVLATANGLADDDRDITAEDRRTVVFCAIQDLETALTYSDEDSLLRALTAANEDRFLGWRLPDIRSKIEGDTAEPKPFPFQLDEVLPWAAKMSSLAADPPPDPPLR